MHPPSPFALLAGTGMMLVAVAAVAGWWWRTRIAFKFFGWGVLAWCICLVLRFGFGGAASKVALPFFRAHVSAPWASLCVYAFLGLLAALVEITIPWFLVARTRLREMTTSEAVGFGIGLGAIEALLLGAYAVFGVVLGLTEYDQIPFATKLQLAQLDSSLRIATPSLERAWTIAGVLVGTLVVWAVQRRVRWLWAALVFKVGFVMLTTWAVDHFGLKTIPGMLEFEATGAAYVALWSIALLVISRRRRAS